MKVDKQKRSKRGSGYLYKRNNAYWLEYRANGERIRQALYDVNGLPITTKRDAEEERERITAPLLAKTDVEKLENLVYRYNSASENLKAAEEAAKALKIVDAVQAYITDPGRSKKSGKRTSVGYVRQFNRFTDWMKKTFPDVSYMRDIDKSIVKKYIRNLEAANISPSTFNQHINTLKRFWDVLESDINGGYNLWRTPKQGGIVARADVTAEKLDRRKRALTIDEVNAVIDVSSGDMRNLFILLACTGLRLVDVVKLKWKSVDLDAGVLEVYPQKTKRRKPEPVFVPVLPQARGIFESIDKKRGYVFPELVKIYDRDRGSTLVKHIRKIILDADIQTRNDKTHGRAIVEVGAHSFRHTFNTLARGAGIPDAMIKKITGHISDEMTDHYTQFTKAIVSKLAANFATLPQAETLTLPERVEHREPLPLWAREIINNMNMNNWTDVKTELLKGGE